MVVGRLWSGGWRVRPKMPLVAQIGLGHFVNEYKAKSVELTGFEPVAPSLRKMRSNARDQGKRCALRVLWGACGPSDVRRGEM